MDGGRTNTDNGVGIVTLAAVVRLSLRDADKLTQELHSRPGARLVYVKLSAGRLKIVPEGP
jgi:hypothetical protein